MATGDGRIFLYPLDFGVPGEVPEARQTGFAQMPTLSLGASRLAWIAGGLRKHIYLMDLATASSPAGTIYRPIAAPRILPEVTLTRTIAQLESAIFAPDESLYVVIKNIRFGTTEIFRYEYGQARIALLATLNLTRPHD